MATFADLSTLLMTFFVLMLSMASIDIQSFREMLGSLREAFGVTMETQGQFQPVITEKIELGEGMGEYMPEEDIAADVKEPVEDIEEVEDPDQPTKEEIDTAKLKEQEKKEREEAAQEIQEAINQANLEDQTEVTTGNQGIRIRVKGALMFDAGSGELKQDAVPLLDNLVMVLQKFDYYLMVEGHSDSSPINTAQFPSNWELSGFRASAVLRYLLTWGIDPTRMTSVGLADNYPIASNETTEGRAQNRRVEFILTKKAFRPSID